MKHATDAALDRVEPLLEAMRALPALRERKRGVFWRESQAFLHSHEDPAGIFADVKLDGAFQRFRATTVREGQALLRRVREALE